MFCDITEISVKAGNGGGGAILFRREKFIPFGGPNGGNGGIGGNVILKADNSLNTLIKLHTVKKFKAKNGQNGMGWLRNGAASEDLILKVPVGTIVKDKKSGEVITDLNEDNLLFVVARGGKGGFGNAHFKTSTRQAPHFAELGEPGEERDIILELKLVADVGIIGLPSVGKSTLISVITSAKPKIADYPFTTLVPNIGIAKVRDSSIVISDIPGLIEGASIGKGLGDEFLRHISRNSVLLHIIDANSENPALDYEIIQKELKSYSHDLIKKKQIIVFNKIDSNDIELNNLIIDSFKNSVKLKKNTKIFCISALMNIGITKLLDAVYKLVEDEKKKEIKPKKEDDIKIYKPLEEESSRYFEVHELDSVIDENNSDIKRREFQIHGARINQIAVMTDFNNSEAVDRLWDVLKKIGVYGKLESLRAKEKDIISFLRTDNKLIYKEKLDIKFS